MNQVTEIALVNAAGAQDPAGFAFAAEACRIQLVEHFLPAWRGHLPDDRPMTVVGYSSTRDLKPGTFWGVEVLSSMDDPGVRGDHGGLRAAGEAWGRSLPDSVVMSHEVLEMALDHFADRWIPLPDGRVIAFECADPVEHDTYSIAATVGGVTRDVLVSNFVCPAWLGEGIGKLDYMGLCKAPGDNRGYMIERLTDGQIVNVFAATATPEYRAKVNAKLGRSSRTAARHDHRNLRRLIDPGAPRSMAMIRLLARQSPPMIFLVGACVLTCGFSLLFWVMR